MKIVRVANPDEFDSTMDSLKDTINAGTPVFVCLFGSEDPKTGESWCPDCVIADPLIRKQLGKVKNAILVECPVGERSIYKGNPNHPYRLHPQIKLTAIPTLLHWTSNGPQASLVEEELANENNILEMVSKL